MGFYKCRRDSEPQYGCSHVQIGIHLLHPSLAPANRVVDFCTSGAITTFDSCLRSAWAIYSGFSYSKLPPLIVGLVKLTTALTATRWRQSEDIEDRSRPWVNLVFLGFHLLTALASIAILTRYFF